MISENRTHRLIAVLIALTALAMITAIAKNIVGLNSITVALLYLLVVLAASSLAGLACGFVIAAASGLLVNYFFLQPFGTFYIEAPEDWISFGSYTITAIVVSHFAATVRKRALEADSMQDQLSRLSKFANALRSVPEKDMTLELVAGELKLAYDLSCCKISLFEENGKSNPLFSVSSSPSSREDKSSSNLHGTLLEVISEEGTDLQCLALKNKNETVGALLIDRITLSHDAAETIASIVSLVVREQVLSPSCRTSHAQD